MQPRELDRSIVGAADFRHGSGLTTSIVEVPQPDILKKLNQIKDSTLRDRLIPVATILTGRTSSVMENDVFRTAFLSSKPQAVRLGFQSAVNASAFLTRVVDEKILPVKKTGENPNRKGSGRRVYSADWVMQLAVLSWARAALEGSGKRAAFPEIVEEANRLLGENHPWTVIPVADSGEGGERDQKKVDIRKFPEFKDRDIAELEKIDKGEVGRLLNLLNHYPYFQFKGGRIPAPVIRFLLTFKEINLAAVEKRRPIFIPPAEIVFTRDLLPSANLLSKFLNEGMFIDLKDVHEKLRAAWERQYGEKE